MAQIDIRPATAADAGLILGFIRELAVYEKAEQEVLATEEDLRRSLFGAQPRAWALICHVDGVAAGFAVYFFNYSTWQGRQGLLDLLQKTHDFFSPSFSLLCSEPS